MGIFLRAKHWQLFLVIFALPMIFYIGIFVNMFATMAVNIETNAVPNPAMMFSWFKWFPVLIVVVIGTLLAWEWSIVMGLQKFIPVGVKMKTSLFKVFFFSPVVYFIILGIFMVQMFNGAFFQAVNGGGVPPSGPPTGLLIAVVIILPLHFYSIFCMFYIIFFAAKTLRTAELQREVTFSDFVGEFFMLMFYFVGVWLIQPRINKLYNSDIPSNDLSDSYIPPQSY